MSHVRLPPGPSSEDAHQFWQAYAVDPGGGIRTLYEEYGPIFRVPTPAGRHMTGIVGADATHQILAAHHGNFRAAGAFTYLRDVAPRVMIAYDGEYHDRMRALLMPALHKTRIDHYLGVMLRYTEHAMDRWPLDTPIEMAAKMRELTLPVVSKALLDLDAGDEQFGVITDAIKIMAEFATPMRRTFRGDPNQQQRYRSARETVQTVVARLISDRRARGDDRGDFLSMLIAAQDDEAKTLTDDEIIDNMWGLFFAGHDTTAHAVAWALYVLSQNPQELQAARDELDRVLGDALPTVEDLGRLQRIEWITKETLRLFPSAPSIPRVAVAPFPVGEYVIPEGDLVVCFIFLTHRLPEIFRDPDRFIPERWAPDSGETHPPGSYAPFSIGPRWCPGMPFALMEMKEILSVALRRFSFTVEPGQTIIFYAAPPAAHPSPGIVMRAKPFRQIQRLEPAATSTS